MLDTLFFCFVFDFIFLLFCFVWWGNHGEDLVQSGSFCPHVQDTFLIHFQDLGHDEETDLGFRI